MTNTSVLDGATTEVTISTGSFPDRIPVPWPLAHRRFLPEACRSSRPPPERGEPKQMRGCRTVLGNSTIDPGRYHSSPACSELSPILWGRRCELPNCQYLNDEAG